MRDLARYQIGIEPPLGRVPLYVAGFGHPPAASVYWKCDPSVHGAFDTSRTDGGPVFQYFVQAAGHVQTAVLAILRAAGFTVERDDQDPLALLILAGPST
ncbi:hypothetical protein [Streptomyces xanthochromogenes]|uniref:hypothetical protein n=1 Tax=Streptomyces xanthochromogenes TaxID=67384 RepID=UPI002F4136B8